MKLYHYTDKPFNQIDASKCDGFWMTTIAPTQTELLDEIGANGLSYCLVCEFNDSGEYILNGSNYDVAEQLESENADFIENRYDGFTDYAITNPSLVKILETIKL